MSASHSTRAAARKHFAHHALAMDVEASESRLETRALLASRAFHANSQTSTDCHTRDLDAALIQSQSASWFLVAQLASSHDGNTQGCLGRNTTHPRCSGGYTDWVCGAHQPRRRHATSSLAGALAIVGNEDQRPRQGSQSPVEVLAVMPLRLLGAVEQVDRFSVVCGKKWLEREARLSFGLGRRGEATTFCREQSEEVMARGTRPVG